jgi:hypothetical protein
MTPEVAGRWLDVLAAIMAAAWLAGAWFVRRTRDHLATPLALEFEVAAAPAAATDALTRALCSAHVPPLGGSLVDEARNGAVRWHSDRLPRHQGSAVVRGDARGSRIRVEVIATGGGLMLGARLVTVAGMLLVAGLYWALGTYVATSDSPSVRSQVLQMVQAVHLLWPPFLLAGLARMLRSRVGAELRRAVQNAAVGG